MSKKIEIANEDGVQATTDAPDSAATIQDAQTRRFSRKQKKMTKSPPETTAESAAPHTDVESAPDAPAQEDGEAVQIYRDRLLRLQADFDNFRKRTQRERNDLYRMANEDLVQDLLPVIDHIQLALDAAGNDPQSKALAEGVQLVLDQLQGALKKYSLEPVDAVGQPFDPNMHQALSQAPSVEFDENVVMFQHRRGYMLGSKLLRAAQVVISLGPGPNGADAARSADATHQES